MLKAVELLAARRRDDLRVVGYQCGSLPEYHVIFEASAVDTEVDPPGRIGVPFGLEWYLPGKSSIYGKGGPGYVAGMNEMISGF